MRDMLVSSSLLSTNADVIEINVSRTVLRNSPSVLNTARRSTQYKMLLNILLNYYFCISLLTDTRVSNRWHNKFEFLFITDGILCPSCPTTMYAIILWVLSPSKISFTIRFKIIPAMRDNGARLHLKI